ncbi:MAG: hypothetical protein AMXMBFR33_41350 [Candidatus Xenobia bacterium]
MTPGPLEQARAILARWAHQQALLLAADQQAYMASGQVSQAGIADLARRRDSIARLLPDKLLLQED